MLCVCVLNDLLILQSLKKKEKIIITLGILMICLRINWGRKGKITRENENQGNDRRWMVDNMSQVKGERKTIRKMKDKK